MARHHRQLVFLQLPEGRSDLYLPGHRVTASYVKGIGLLREFKKSRFEKAVRIFSAEPRFSPCYGLARGNMGLALLNLEKIPEAEKALAEALAVFEKSGCPQPPSWVQFMRHHADCIKDLGQPVASLEIYHQACELAANLCQKYSNFRKDIHLEQAHALSSWGGVYIRLGRSSKAIPLFNESRSIYSAVNDPGQVGHAEVLSNLALAHISEGDHHQASLAVQEAASIAIKQNNHDQLHRVLVTAIQADPTLVIGAPYQVLDAAIEFSKNLGHAGNAYLRLCIKATTAIKFKDFNTAIETCEIALKLEARLDFHNPNPAKIRYSLAEARSLRGDPLTEIIPPLIEGAALWYESLKTTRFGGDFDAKSSDMHDHFRCLSRKLADAGRSSEAV